MIQELKTAETHEASPQLHVRITAAEADTALYSEDLNYSQNYGDVTVITPFSP
ncbi:MAG: hypothetical protein QNK82_16385 [Akkermansiaceae bacterium]